MDIIKTTEKDVVVIAPLDRLHVYHPNNDTTYVIELHEDDGYTKTLIESLFRDWNDEHLYTRLEALAKGLPFEYLTIWKTPQAYWDTSKEPTDNEVFLRYSTSINLQHRDRDGKVKHVDRVSIKRVELSAIMSVMKRFDETVVEALKTAGIIGDYLYISKPGGEDTFGSWPRDSALPENFMRSGDRS